jgi:hypothetical protein
MAAASAAARIIFEQLRAELDADRVRRLRFEDLEQLAGLTASELCRRLRVSGARLRELRACGLDTWQADRYAVRAGLHPIEVWGDAWTTCDDDDEQLDTVGAGGG